MHSAKSAVLECAISRAGKSKPLGVWQALQHSQRRKWARWCVDVVDGVIHSHPRCKHFAFDLMHFTEAKSHLRRNVFFLNMARKISVTLSITFAYDNTMAGAQSSTAILSHSVGHGGSRTPTTSRPSSMCMWRSRETTEQHIAATMHTV